MPWEREAVQFDVILTISVLSVDRNTYANLKTEVNFAVFFSN